MADSQKVVKQVVLLTCLWFLNGAMVFASYGLNGFLALGSILMLFNIYLLVTTR